MAFSKKLNMTKTKLFISMALIILSLGMSAQDKPSGFAPTDPEIRTGRLDNGLTYYIRHNKEPEKRASFYIIQNVGAILEKDDQNGLAHFLEHMAFNGTKNFPGKAIISGLEKHGVAFGRNINAYTGFDETVYNLSDVPVEVPGLIDSCLLVLHDWSDYITLSEKEIDLERGVIAEEWRTSKTASRRMIFDVIPVVLKGSKYAVRDIIGDLEVIKNFSYSSLRSFYHDWYRTDLQAIAVVGDINVDETEAKIRKLFSGIAPVSNPLPRLPEEVPFHSETYYVLAQDKEAPQTSVSVVALHKAVPREKKDLAYIRDNHVISLMNSMVNTRISELLQKGNPPFVNGSVSYGAYYARGYDAFFISANARKNEEALALEAIYTEAERARKHGFNKNELERAKARMLANYENYFKQKDKIQNDTYISGMQEHYLNGEPLTSIDFDYEYLKQVIGTITPEEVSQKFRQLMIDQNRTIIVQGLEGEDIVHVSEEEALSILGRVRSEMQSPYEDAASDMSLINTELKGAPIIKTVSLDQFDAEEWTLANNVKVVYRKADYEKDNVILSAFSFGGVSRLPDNMVLPAALLPSVLPMYGTGDFDNITLQKMMSGKKASVSVTLAETTEGLSGTCTPGDFETMMQLLYLRFAAPRFDAEAHNAIISRYAAQIGSMEKDPNKIMNDSITLISTGYHPRTPVLTKESIGSISIDQMKQIYEDRFKNADEFIFFIVGNIEKDIVMAAATKYLGSLPAGGRTETWTDRKVSLPDGKTAKDISIPLTIPKSTVFLAFENEIRYEPYYYLGLSVIKGILDIVYVEKVREDEGGTYGVGVSITSQKRPSETGEAYIQFDCDPARATELKAIIYREIDNIVKYGPRQEDLDKAVNNLLKTREESKLHNSYWSTTLSRYYSFGINNDDPASYEDVLKSFTIKDIKKIAGKMFKKADVVDLVFKPAEQ